MMVERIKKNKLLTVVAMVYMGLALTRTEMAVTSLGNSSYYLIEMAQILPVIFMLTVAIDVLIPKEWIIKRLGEQSGVSGALLALVFGSISAGPIYAAFPITKMLHKKGASVNNIVIILSAWAVVKVPMLANEAKFLGPDFMAVRWLLTVTFIFVMAWVMGQLKVKIVDEEEVSDKQLFIKGDYCIGCTACSKSMPGIFEMKDSKAFVVDEQLDVKSISPEEVKLLEKTVAKCPTRAIVMHV